MGLSPSKAKNTSVEPISKAAVPISIILLCRERRRTLFLRTMSRMTVYPRPPRITSAAITKRTDASWAKPIRLSDQRANPALLNADTA